MIEHTFLRVLLRQNQRRLVRLITGTLDDVPKPVRRVVPTVVVPSRYSTRPRYHGRRILQNFDIGDIIEINIVDFCQIVDQFRFFEENRVRDQRVTN